MYDRGTVFGLKMLSSGVGRIATGTALEDPGFFPTRVFKQLRLDTLGGSPNIDQPTSAGLSFCAGFRTLGWRVVGCRGCSFDAVA